MTFEEEVEQEFKALWPVYNYGWARWFVLRVAKRNVATRRQAK